MPRREPIPIRGIDFEQSNSLEAIVRSLVSTGFQASNLGRAIELLNELIADRAPLYLSFTGNIVSSGLREVIAFLVKHRYVAAIVTTASGIEEDTIKSLGSFGVDRFDTPGNDLLERQRYRIGNISVPRSLYATFENFLQPMLARACERQANKLPPTTPSELIADIGHALEDRASFLYWAARNKVPVYCPGVSDGAMGDNFVSYVRRNPGLWIDVVRDHRQLVDEVNRHKRPIGAIVLGGGISKHYLLNASLRSATYPSICFRGRKGAGGPLVGRVTRGTHGASHSRCRVESRWPEIRSATASGPASGSTLTARSAPQASSCRPPRPAW